MNNTISYVYVIGPKEGYQKIGISYNPNKRLKELQTGHPNKLFVHHKEEVLDDIKFIMERIIHKSLNHRRTHNEWFDIPIEDAIKHIQFCMITHSEDPALKYKYKNNCIIY